VTAFLVEVADDKSGVMSPTIVGPFANADEAEAFADRLEMGMQAQSGMGGYSAVHVVAAETAETPAAYAAAWDEVWGEDEEAS
jgi:hypothetical protein